MTTEHPSAEGAQDEAPELALARRMDEVGHAYMDGLLTAGAMVIRRLHARVQELERAALASAAQQKGEPVEREPLSKQQIEDLCGEANRGFNIEYEQYEKAFKDAERAHGIAPAGPGASVASPAAAPKAAPAPATSAPAIIRELVEHIEQNTCEHHDTYRGGAIWEICSDCGAKWADDEGGKPEFKWPDCVERAWEFLSASRGQAPAPAVAQEPGAWRDYAEHLEWCRTCAEDGVRSCHEGARLKASAMEAPAAQGDAPQLDAVRQAIRDYYFALDSRRHGDVAAHASLNAIERALGMQWEQGAEAAARAQAKEGGSSASRPSRPA